MDKIYRIYIYEKYSELKNSEKELNNLQLYRDLSKIFEWYTCIKLKEKYNKIFYEYNDIDPTFKEDNQMSRNDSGIDCCDMIDTIVQCKLRKNNLTWSECSTFFASQNIFNEELNQTIVKWPKLIISRNKECQLSQNLLVKSKLFTDITFSKQDILDYCDNLIVSPPKYPKIKLENFELRDYQVEAIKLIKSNKNIIISLPTGCGKNVVIIHSFEKNKKYLILVPRIILMEQLYNEIIKHNPELKHQIQCIGDNNSDECNKNKNICICVYNSIHIIENNLDTFTKIYIDEAHHIDKPVIYEDDSDEENENNKETYYNIIANLRKYNNNVYLSATIDEIDGFAYYKKDIRDMIEQKYLCDYTMNIPIFTNNPTNKNICEYLIKNYRNIIIYCNSQKEGNEINHIMNEIQNNCSKYIDCNTPKTLRNKIIKEYKEGTISFLINVRILVEGFDAPITKGVCFMHLPSSKTTLIQIIGRALRLHPLKTIANIILPYSCDEDRNSINHFIRVIAMNDKRIRQSYENKKLGGYISIDNIEENNEESEFKFNMIYNNLGEILNGSELWLKRLEEVKKYIDENNKRPSSLDDNKYIKQLSLWINTHIQNYKNNKGIMIKKEIYNNWFQFINSDKYKEYFISYEEKWYNNFNAVKQYILKNKKRPNCKDNDNDIRKLGQWLTHQPNYYKNKEQIMTNENIYNEWGKFINSDKYKKYFISNEENWYNTFTIIKDYININKKRPCKRHTDYNIKKLGLWFNTQINNYKNRKQIMTNDEIYNEWTEFINSKKYKEYFVKPIEIIV